MKQLNLFDNFDTMNPKNKSKLVKSLVVEVDKESPALKRLKRNFTSRLEAIPKLKKEIENLHKKIAQLSQLYNKEIKPVADKIDKGQDQALAILDNLYQRKSFTQSEKVSLQEKIIDILNDLTQSGYQVDEKYMKYYTIGDFKNQVKEFFAQMTGKNIDLDDFVGPDKMTDEEIKEKYADQLNEDEENTEINEQELSDKNNQHEAFDLHIQKLYKSMAKKIHPDLEMDEKKRKVKEKLMQELTNAKKNQDVFEMITLKLKVDQYYDEQTTIDEQFLHEYAEKLLNQKKALEDEIYLIKNYSGHQSWLYQNFHTTHPKGILNKINAYKEELMNNLQYLEDLIDAGASVKKMKSFLKDEQEEDDFFENFIFIEDDEDDDWDD
jgi:hypothetical protein